MRGVCLALLVGAAGATPNYTKAEIAERVQGLVDELTDDEKYSLLNGVGYSAASS